MRSWQIASAAIFAAVVLAACDSGGTTLPGTVVPISTGTSGNATPAAPHTVSAPLGTARTLEFVVTGGITTIALRDGGAGSDLYRISTPNDSRVRPVVANSSGRVELQFAGTGLQGPASVEISLSPVVTWALRFSGGATDTVVDMSSGKVSAVEFSAGLSRIELSLPTPAGTVTARMAGGASQWVVHAPSGVPVQVRIGGGAGAVNLAGVVSNGVSAGAVLSEPGFDTATNRIVLDATAGVSTVVVDHK